VPKFSYDEFQRAGPQLGTNPGGVHEHKGTGEKWYVKFPQMHREFHPSHQAMMDHQENHARSEVLAGKLYERAGIGMPEMHLVRHAGGAPGGRGDQIGVASKIIPGLRESSDTLHHAKGAAHGFATDAWLGNYDAVGYGHDNMLVDSGHNAVRIDPGASMRYKAQGAPKTGTGAKSWGPRVDELRMLQGPQHDHAWEEQNMANVFSRADKGHIHEGAKRVTNIPDHEIRSIVSEHGPRDPSSNTKLADTLVSRKQHIGDHFGLNVTKSMRLGMNSDWGSNKPLQPRNPDRRLLVHPYQEARVTLKPSALAQNNYTTPTRSGNMLRKAVGEASERVHGAADEAAWAAPGKRLTGRLSPEEAKVREAQIREAISGTSGVSPGASNPSPSTSSTPIQRRPGKSLTTEGVGGLEHLEGLERSLGHVIREAQERVQHAATTADPKHSLREEQRQSRLQDLALRRAKEEAFEGPPPKSPAGPGSPAGVILPFKKKSLTTEGVEGLEHLIGLEKALVIYDDVDKALPAILGRIAGAAATARRVAAPIVGRAVAGTMDRGRSAAKFSKEAVQHTGRKLNEKVAERAQKIVDKRAQDLRSRGEADESAPRPVGLGEADPSPQSQSIQDVEEKFRDQSATSPREEGEERRQLEIPGLEGGGESPEDQLQEISEGGAGEPAGAGGQTVRPGDPLGVGEGGDQHTPWSLWEEGAPERPPAERGPSAADRLRDAGRRAASLAVGDRSSETHTLPSGEEVVTTTDRGGIFRGTRKDRREAAAKRSDKLARDIKRHEAESSRPVADWYAIGAGLASPKPLDALGAAARGVGGAGRGASRGVRGGSIKLRQAAEALRSPGGGRRRS